MSKYELDDGLVKQFIDGDWTSAHMGRLVAAFTEQLALQLPTGLGAVVRLADGRTAVRSDNSDFCWCVHLGTNANDWLTDATLPRITEVLSAGVQE